MHVVNEGNRKCRLDLTDDIADNQSEIVCALRLRYPKWKKTARRRLENRIFLRLLQWAYCNRLDTMNSKVGPKST